MSPHEVLGVSESASRSTVTRAYRKLASKYHPDKNPGDPVAEESFKQVKEAYEFLTTGYSSTASFKPKPPKPKKPKSSPPPPPPPPVDDGVIYANGYGAKNVLTRIVWVSMADSFTGVTARVEEYFQVKVAPGVQHGFRERRLCTAIDLPHFVSRDAAVYFDLEYRLHDPSGFYQLEQVGDPSWPKTDGLRLCCRLQMTTGQLLSGFEHSLKDLDPTSERYHKFTVPIKHARYVRLVGAGLLRDRFERRRGDLFVMPVVTVTPIEDEIYPVLQALQRKVNKTIDDYEYFKGYRRR